MPLPRLGMLFAQNALGSRRRPARGRSSMATTSATDTRTGYAASAASQASALMTVLYLVQGVYYLLTGVWPLVSIDTFQMVTGPKTDLWLVQTVGALII